MPFQKYIVWWYFQQKSNKNNTFKGQVSYVDTFNTKVANYIISMRKNLIKILSIRIAIKSELKLEFYTKLLTEQKQSIFIVTSSLERSSTMAKGLSLPLATNCGGFTSEYPSSRWIAFDTGKNLICPQMRKEKNCRSNLPTS